MPHKRNPITCERICGMARLLRGYAQSAYEDQALWHERDISPQLRGTCDLAGCDNRIKLYVAPNNSHH